MTTIINRRFQDQNLLVHLSEELIQSVIEQQNLDHYNFQ